MPTNAITRTTGTIPGMFDDFFKPWNEWFSTPWKGLLSVPAVNIEQHEKEFMVSLAVPGMKKEDFKIDITGNLLTISSEKEENKEEKEKEFTRREYNYSSFSRTFTLPEEVNKEGIGAKYEDGVLKLSLPRREAVTMPSAKTITVQ